MVCVRARLCTHWVNVYEEAMLLFIWRESLHVVQQNRVGVEKVRMGDEDRRVWTVERLKRTQRQIINRTKTARFHTDEGELSDSLWRQLLTFRRPDCRQGQKPSLGA